MVLANLPVSHPAFLSSLVLGKALEEETPDPRLEFGQLNFSPWVVRNLAEEYHFMYTTIPIIACLDHQQ